MVVWGGAMVCRTNLILKANRTNLLLLIPGDVVSAYEGMARGGGGGTGWESSSPRPGGPTRSPPPPLRVNTWSGCRQCTCDGSRPRRTRVRCQNSRLDKAPPRSLTPDRQYRRQRPLQLVNMIHRALGPTGRGLLLKITACTTTKKGLHPPVTTQQTEPSCTPHAATYKELIPRTSHH